MKTALMQTNTIYLSDHFTLAEMIKSQTAIRHDIVNFPAEHEIIALRYLCHGLLEPIRQYFSQPYSPQSGYRCSALNEMVGGSGRSQHMSGQAVDIELPGIDNYTLASWIKDNLLYDQLILEFYEPGHPHSGWVHVSLLDETKEASKRNRKQVLTRNADQYFTGLVA